MSATPEDQIDDRAPRPFLVGALASSLCAAYANVACSVLEAPSAFSSAVSLLEPLAVTAAVVALAQFVLTIAVGSPLWRWLRDRAKSRRSSPVAGYLPVVVGQGVLVVLVCSLAPALEVLGRDVSPGHRALLYGVAGLAVVGTSLSAFLLTERWNGRALARAFAAYLPLGAPLFALLVLAFVWALRFGPASGTTTGTMSALAAFTTLFGVLVFWLRSARNRGGPLPSLFTLLVLTLVSPLAALVGRGALAGFELDDDAKTERIVLITAESLRHDSLGRNSQVATPRLDAFFADSVVYENARASAPWTTPAVASLFTGASPLVHGATRPGMRVPDELPTLAEKLRDEGYYTAAIGVGTSLDESSGFARGFHEYVVPARGGYGSSFGSKLLSHFDPVRYPSGAASTDSVVDVALDWIRENRRKRFFLWVHLAEPKPPYSPPMHLLAARDPETSIGGSWVASEGEELTGADRERVRQLYHGEVRHLDENVGRLLGRLEAEELYDGALVAFLADHGEELWDHGAQGNGRTLFDEVLRVPLAIKLPSTGARGRVIADVATVALAPTLFELATGTAQDAFEADSLPLRDGTDGGSGVVPPRPVFASGVRVGGDRVMSLFDGWKFVLDLDTGSERLVNLYEDRDELRPVTSSRPERVADARNLLRVYAERAAASRRRYGLAESATVTRVLELLARADHASYRSD